MGMARAIHVMGFFERYEAADVQGVRLWRAFRYIPDGGIWYAADNEDYTICRKDKCGACNGKGKQCCGMEIMGSLDTAQLVCDLCMKLGKREPCRICDGRGFVFVPSIIRQG